MKRLIFCTCYSLHAFKYLVSWVVEQTQELFLNKFLFDLQDTIESLMLVMWHPMDFIDFNLTEVPAFDLEDVLNERLLGVEVVSIVMTP